MAVTTQIQLLVSINGGSYLHGAQTAVFGQSVAMQLASTSGLQAIRYEIYEFPTGFTAPAGWSTDPSGVIFYAPSNVTVPPPSFNIPASGANNWGFFMLRARGNSGAGLNPLRLNADGSPNVSYNVLLTDEASVINVTSPNLHMQGVGFNLSTQIDPLRQWVGSLMQSLRALDGVAAGVLSIAGTGLVHVTSSAVDGTAYHGTADQLVGMNHAGTDTSFFSLTGDGSLASGALTVTGIQGRPVSNSAPSPSQALVWNGSTWAPANQAGAISVTGSGVWHSISGSLQAAAMIGTADQLFGTNHGATDVAFFTLSGDASIASGSITVTGIQTKAVPAPSGTGTVLTWNAGSSGLMSWAAAGGAGAISAFGQDLVNSTATLQYVSGLSYNATAAGGGAGGAIGVRGTGTTLNWVNDAITLQQAGTSLLSLKAVAGDFLAFGTTPGSSGFIRATANATVLQVAGFALIATASDGTPTFGFSAPATATGASAYFRAQDAGSAAVPGGSAYVVSGVGTTSGATGNIVFGLGGTATTNQIAFLGAAANGNPGNLGTMQWASGMTPVIMQAATLAAVAPDFTIFPSMSIAATNWTNGNLVVSLRSPGGTGVPSTLVVKDAGSAYVSLGQLYNGSTALMKGAVWLGNQTGPTNPTGTNYTLKGDNVAASPTGTTLNTATATAISLAVNDVAQMQLSIIGGSPALSFTRTMQSPVISQATPNTDILAQSLSISAQSAWTSASSNVFGGTLILTGGNAKSNGVSGRRGGVQLSIGVQDTQMVEMGEYILGQRILGFAALAPLGTTQMPANTGDGVIFVGNANTAPTANANFGGILYAQGGALKWRGSSGTITTIGPA